MTPPPPLNADAAQDSANAEMGRIRRSLTSDISRRIALPTGDPNPAARVETDEHLRRTLAGVAGHLSEAARSELHRDVMNEVFGFGPIQPLLEDPSVTEIMVNRADRVYVERAGKPMRTAVVFDDNAHILRVIDRILVPLGKSVTPDTPLVDARLPDGSRVNAVIPPVAVAGPCLTIRKFSSKRPTLEELARLGALTPMVTDFLRACVLCRMNIVVTGGTGSGKTTFLNALSGCVPADERIVTIEDAAELRLAQDHVITLESKQPNVKGGGEVTIRDLVRNALRMRPERIIVGECRGGETLDMLQAMNTGHDGSLTTLHANSPRDALARIETMTLMAGIELPVRAIREQIGSAVQLLVHLSRMRDGSRKVTHVTEISGLEGDRIVMQDLFRFKEVPTPTTSAVSGSLQACGLRPQFMPKLELAGIRLSPTMFTPGAMPPPRNAA